jgi:hypothetical protein
MSYAPDTAHVQEVVIHGRMSSQEIINKLYLRWVGVAGGGGVSFTLLTNFIVAFRATILTKLYADYAVDKYVMREIDGAIMTAAGPPSKWRPTYPVTGIETILGDPVLDAGALAIGANKPLTADNSVRVFKAPSTALIRYYRSTYNRFTSWTTAEKDATREQWTAAACTAFNGVWTTFVGTDIFADGAALVPYRVCLWSLLYYGRIIKPAGGSVRDASTGISAVITLRTIGTQMTRSFNTAGLPRGR